MSESAFWRFSLRLYALPGVAPACIELQDGSGADINVLFLLLYLADCRRALARDDVALIDTTIAPWRNAVVRPLRAARRALKNDLGVSGSAALRKQVKHIELESERLQQEALYALFAAAEIGVVAPRETAARSNLAAYARFLGGMPQAPLDTVLQAFHAM